MYTHPEASWRFASVWCGKLEESALPAETHQNPAGPQQDITDQIWVKIVLLSGWKVGHWMYLLQKKKKLFFYFCNAVTVRLLVMSLLRATAGFSPCCQLMLMMPSPCPSLHTRRWWTGPVSARLTFSYHNLIILMILLLNLRRCTCIPRRDATVERVVWIPHEAGKMSKGDNIQWCVYPCVCERQCVQALVHKVRRFPQTNTSQQQWPQPHLLTQRTRGRLWRTICMKQPSSLLLVKHYSQRGLDCGVSSLPIELSGLI